MSKKSELAISELNLLYECTSKENVFHKNKIKKIIDILSDEQTESDQSANKNQVSKPIGHSTRLKANTPMPEKELTWESIFKKHNLYKEECNHNQKSWLPLESWLDENYNVPTRKI